MKTIRTIAVAAGTLSVAAGGVAAVAARGEDPQHAAASVTVYTSLPLQGAQRTLSESMVNGVRLALEQADYRAGDFRVRWHSLDDSTAETGHWDPGQTAANARRAAVDPGAVAYIGEFNSGATAIAMPILNEAGLAQVSAGSTAVGLTSDAPGSAPGEPRRYIPTGRRTFVRVVPNDVVQGAALARLMGQEGCERVLLLNDGELYGVGLARNIASSAGESGLKILASERIDPEASGYRDLAASARRRGADCIAFAGAASSNAVQLFRHLATGVPGAKLFGADAVAESSFANDAEGGIPPAVARRTLVTAPTLEPGAYPPAGRRFFDAYRHRYGTRNPEPYAIYGYEAMRVVLDAIARSGPRATQRPAVVAELRDPRPRRSPLGSYRIDGNGDTTLTDYGVYRVRDGGLVFDRAIRRTREELTAARR